jgi:hypothetical protein
MGSVSPILFHHYQSAEMHNKALKYCIRAAEYPSLHPTAMKRTKNNT